MRARERVLLVLVVMMMVRAVQVARVGGRGGLLLPLVVARHSGRCRRVRGLRVDERLH